MATSMLSSDPFHTSSDETHLEIFCLVWLDAGSSAADGRDTEQKLRSIINKLKKFHDVAPCQKYIHERSSKERIVMIVSGRLGREIVPAVHHLRQVISIYVYCMDQKGNKEWADKFTKVKAVVVDLDELISRIKADHKIQKMVEEPLSINIFTTGGGAGNSTTGLNGEFVFSQVLMDCLIRLQYTEVDKKELINLCKKQYKGNSIELSIIREFQDDYSSNNVLRWYTRESFFYKTLNAALRTPADIHTIFLFRKYIADIQDQLQKYQQKHSLRVYRSQMISTNELETLKKNIGQFISVNSFFSTSVDKQQALSFLKIPDDIEDLEGVLFQIDADPKMAINKPFADISKFSEFTDEAEVLFMLGSIFRLESVKRNKHSQVWIIQITLCNDHEHDLKQVLITMKEQLVDEDPNLQTLAKILWEMSQFSLAEKYFIRLLDQLSPDDPLHIDLYQDLGRLTSHAGQLDKSMEWRRRAIEFKKQISSASSSSISKPKNPLDESKKAKPKSTPVVPKPMTKIEPISKAVPTFTIPLRSSSIDIHPNARWEQNGLTVTGGHGQGNEINQLNCPLGLYVDENQTVYVADQNNHRIMEWKSGATSGQVVAGGQQQGNKSNQLSDPRDVIVDKETESLIICDYSNGRVVRWPRRNGTSGETIISNIGCGGLTIDENGSLYVSDWGNHEVRRYRRGESQGTVVAGGNGDGNRLDQLSYPTYVFIDRDHSVYVSELRNPRVMKWMEGAKQGIVVAGGQGQGNSLTQLSYPKGIVVDQLGTVYVADLGNARIMRWPKGATQGSVIVGGNGSGKQSSQLNGPVGLSFDRHGNLYVVDNGNHRVQKFNITFNG